LLLNLSVAAFTIGVLAPILESGATDGGGFSVLRSLAAGFGGLALAAAGLYLVGVADSHRGGRDER
jgi:hypothetical protein